MCPVRRVIQLITKADENQLLAPSWLPPVRGSELNRSASQLSGVSSDKARLRHPLSTCCLASRWKEDMAFLRSFYVADDIWRFA